MLPERVRIGTPSSGVKPIVVSADRPSRTAVTEQPPPRWQTARRGTRTWLATHSTFSPWKPQGRVPPAVGPGEAEGGDAPGGGDPLGAPPLRHGRVERGVERGHLRQARKRGARLA